MHLHPSILFETPNLIAVDKPAGILVHPTNAIPGIDTKKFPESTPNDHELTLVDWLLKRYPEIKSVGDQPGLRPGIVHRLDRATSGVMVAARTQEAFEHLKRQFKERRVRKTYLALVRGVPSNAKGSIDLPIGRVGIKRVAGPPQNKAKNVKEALTHWEVLKSFARFSLLEVHPITGRTNQIRVHLNAINHPIACDPIYGGRQPVCPYGLNRLFLHAAALELTDLGGRRLKFESPLPDDLQKTLDVLESY